MTKYHGTEPEALEILLQYAADQRSELSAAHSELDQLGGLLNDAIVRLTSSFSTISALTARHRELSLAMKDSSRGGKAECLLMQSAANEKSRFHACSDADHSRASETNDECDLSLVLTDIERHVNEIVLTLQFQDTASQLLCHVMKRIKIIEQIAGELERFPDTEIDVLRESLSCMRIASSRNPVGQVHIREGEVELFSSEVVDI